MQNKIVRHPRLPQFPRMNYHLATHYNNCIHFPLLVKHYLASIILESLTPREPSSVTASPVVSLGRQNKVTTELLRNASDLYARTFPITLLEFPLLRRFSDLKSRSLLTCPLLEILIPSSIPAMVIWYFSVTWCWLLLFPSFQGLF